VFQFSLVYKTTIPKLNSNTVLNETQYYLFV
jgi:hypothetical protein